MSSKLILDFLKPNVYLDFSVKNLSFELRFNLQKFNIKCWKKLFPFLNQSTSVIELGGMLPSSVR